MVEDLPGLPEKEVVINRVFDHLLESPVERGLPDVLQNLLLISQTVKPTQLFSMALHQTLVRCSRLLLSHVDCLKCDCKVNAQWSNKYFWLIKYVMTALTLVCVSTDHYSMQLLHTDVSVFGTWPWVSGVSCAEICYNSVFLSQISETVSGFTFPAVRDGDSGLPHNWRTQAERSKRWLLIFIISHLSTPIEDQHVSHYFCWC